MHESINRAKEMDENVCMKNDLAVTYEPIGENVIFIRFRWNSMYALCSARAVSFPLVVSFRFADTLH